MSHFFDPSEQDNVNATSQAQGSALLSCDERGLDGNIDSSSDLNQHLQLTSAQGQCDALILPADQVSWSFGPHDASIPRSDDRYGVEGATTDAHATASSALQPSIPRGHASGVPQPLSLGSMAVPPPALVNQPSAPTPKRRRPRRKGAAGPGLEKEDKFILKNCINANSGTSR